LVPPRQETDRNVGGDFFPHQISTGVGFNRFGRVSDAVEGRRVFDEGGDSLLSIRLLNGKLPVSTHVRDGGGNLIAEMKDNEWKHQEQPAIFDRNYTQDVLEIRDSTGKVVLQAANLGNTVDLAAIFHCKNGWTYMVGPIAGKGSAIELRRPDKPLRSEILPVCDYPSDRHLGSCPGIERLKQMASGPHTTYPLYFPVHLCL
jgi:hypothetical protein